MSQPTPPPSTTTGPSQAQSHFTLAASGRMTEDRVNECHRAVTQFVVKGLHPFSTVESKGFREMTNALNCKYTPPCRNVLSSTLIPAWYNVEKANVIAELKDVPKLAITTDGWTSLTQDHYLTVTAHYTSQGSVKQKVFKTRAVYQAQTGDVVVEEITDILEEFSIEVGKIVAVTVDNAANMDVAIRKLHVLKIGCFAHTLNIAAHKIYQISAIDRWAGRITAVVVWMKRSSMAKTVLKEKQQLLDLPQHTMILDVKTRWNSLFLMVERFMEQYPAIQAASMDPRLRKQMEKDKLGRLKDEDFQKAEEFVQLMRVMYTSTLCVSSEQTPTCGQILPILRKLEDHFTVQEEDTLFVSSIKEKVWGNLSGRYQEETIQAFLLEATAMDPRFKGKMESDATWDRLREAAVAEEEGHTEEQGHTDKDQQQQESEEEGKEETATPLYKPRNALEELFADEDMELRTTMQQNTLSVSERVDHELQLYKGLPSIPMSESPALWWWEKRGTLPLLTQLATTYLCAQASSTPSERVFSTAGDTISQERSRLLLEKADMLIFLQKNC